MIFLIPILARAPIDAMGNGAEKSLAFSAFHRWRLDAVATGMTMRADHARIYSLIHTKIARQYWDTESTANKWIGRVKRGQFTQYAAHA